MPGPPRFLLGLTLLFWGAMTKNVVPGIALALLVEGAHWTRVRWNFGDWAFLMAWRLSVLFLLVAMALVLLQGARLNAMAKVFTWLPVILIPLQFVQSYGMSRTTTLATFSMMVRRRREHARKFGLPFREVHFSFGQVYFCAVLLGSSLGTDSDHFSFYPSLTILAVWALAHAAGKPGRGVAAATVIAVLLSAAGGLAGQRGLTFLYHYITSGGGSGGSRLDYARERRTAFEDMGEIKNSPEIQWRLIPENGPLPSLLRVASYSKYVQNNWDAELLPEGTVRETEGFDQLPEISNPANPDDPADVFIITPPDLPDPKVAAAPDLRASGCAGPLRRSARASGAYSPCRPRRPACTNSKATPWSAIPSALSASIRRSRSATHRSCGILLSRLSDRRGPRSISNTSPCRRPNKRRAETTAGRLSSRCSQICKSRPTRPPLFTRSSMSWVCATRACGKKLTGCGSISSRTSATPATIWARERTAPSGRAPRSSASSPRPGPATASTSPPPPRCCCREAGVPTRYATGFAVIEFDTEKGEAVLRGTHAHAWCRAWDAAANRWLDVDLTPPDWTGMETPRPSRFQGLSDWIQRHREDLLVWRDKPGHMLIVIACLLSPILIGLVFVGRNLWRSRSRLDPVKALKRGAATVAVTPLLELEKPARKILGERPPGTPLARWLMQLAPRLTRPDRLAEALKIHHLLRFDPDARDPELVTSLQGLVADLKKEM